VRLSFYGFGQRWPHCGRTVGFCGFCEGGPDCHRTQRGWGSGSGDLEHGAVEGQLENRERSRWRCGAPATATRGSRSRSTHRSVTAIRGPFSTAIAPRYDCMSLKRSTTPCCGRPEWMWAVEGLWFADGRSRHDSGAGREAWLLKFRPRSRRGGCRRRGRLAGRGRGVCVRPRCQSWRRYRCKGGVQPTAGSGRQAGRQN
jgi:hypothetical protein